jgi:hypothetical protein
MRPFPPRRLTSAPPFLWLALGVALGIGAWLLPVNLGSVPPTLLQAAGANTATVSSLGHQLLDTEQYGPAALVLATARVVEDPGAAELAVRLERATAEQPEVVPWGAWDPFLDPLFNLRENRGRTASTPVLTFFITREARESLARYLGNTRSQGVRAVLATRDIDQTAQFVPARRPGGQALDAVILLTALMYQGEHFSAPLQRELRQLAESARDRKDLGAMETFYLDLLSLGRRLDWAQLTELMRRVENTKTVGEFAHLGRRAPDDLALIYTAALATDSADRVAAYLLRFGRAGLEDLRLGLAAGRGAVQQLLLRQVPVNHEAGPTLGAAATLSLLYPRLLLSIKYGGFLIGAFLVFRGLDGLVSARASVGALPHLSSGVLALLTTGLIILVTEPFLLRAAPLSEFSISFSVPVLADVADPSSLQSTPTTLAMDPKTLISIAFFAALQVAVYVICLMKIGEIDRSGLPELVKLRLMENEENLFDAGLYVGIGGTAAALVLQVLGVIEPNLLAAYSSNLFGITCVALVKIRHVRPYKKKLIMESQAAVVPFVATAPAPSSRPV